MAKAKPQNVLIVWFDGAKVSMFIIPSEELKQHDEEMFGRCHGKMINSGMEDEDSNPDAYNRIEYLAWLLGEESHVGPLPTLADWLALQRPPESPALTSEVIGLKKDTATVEDRRKLLAQRDDVYDPPLKKYKLVDDDLLLGADIRDCVKAISTGWYC